MSWFGSWFSSPKQPAVVASTHEPPLTKNRILEEPVPRPEPEPVSEALTSSPPQPIQTNRPNRSAVIFGAGALFCAFSLVITRRAFARKRFASNLAFYNNAPAHQADQATKVNGAVEAMEALSLATLNVLSVSMMATGGAMWYMNINSLADARRTIRGGLGVDGSGRSEKDAEEDFEEWLATTLARKETKGAERTQTNERGQQR